MTSKLSQRAQKLFIQYLRENNLKVTQERLALLDEIFNTNEHLDADELMRRFLETMAEQNATQAERMTPPDNYRMLHPHFLLVLENIERSFHYAAKGDLAKYRQHQKIVRKELNLVEALAEKENLELYLWGRRY